TEVENELSGEGLYWPVWSRNPYTAATTRPRGGGSCWRSRVEGEGGVNCAAVVSCTGSLGGTAQAPTTPVVASTTAILATARKLPRLLLLLRVIIGCSPGTKWWHRSACPWWSR